jgi:hypothetical protein
MAVVESELRTALADRDRFEALALVDLNQDKLLFLETGEGTADGLKPALEAFLLRLVTDTESHDQFKKTDEIVFYDVDGRQLVSHYFEDRGKRYVLVAVVSPQKTYKQVIRRLAKSLKSAL